jgi:hypothetical protein
MSATGMRRRGLMAVVGAVVLAGGVSASALAMNPYTVHIKVPSTVKHGSNFKATFYGESANTSDLRVFHDDQACAATPSREAGHPHAALIVNKDVTNAYSVTKTGSATTLGKHYLCAYLLALPPAKLLRAHASVAYSTVP